MKKYINIKSFLLNLLMLLLFTTAISELQAQESKADNFNIVAEMKDTKVILSCKSGCDWEKLTYHFTNGKSKVVNAYGISDEPVTKKNKKSNYSNFEFVISKTSTGIKLKGIKGVDWNELDIRISKNQLQTISNSGLAH